MSTTQLYEEKTLLDNFRAGDEPAFTELYNRFYQRVFYFAQRYVEEDDAQDVTADTFIQLWRKRADFTQLNSLARFLFVVARNRCYDFHRRQKARNERTAELNVLMDLTEPETPFFEENIRAAVVELLEEQIKQLPEKKREVFLLSFREGLKPAEIAGRLGLSVKTVKNQKLSAIKLLKSAVAGHPLQFWLLLLLTKLEISTLY